MPNLPSNIYDNDIERSKPRLFIVSLLPRELSPAAVVCRSRAQDRAFITCNANVSCATWCKGIAQLLTLTVEIELILTLFHWLKPLADEGGEETKVPAGSPRQRASENARY